MRTRSVVILIIVVVLCVGGIYGWNEYHRTNTDLAGATAAYTVNADQLMHEFETNDSVAEKKYSGKVVEVSGSIRQVEKDESGSYTIALGNGASMSAVRCSMDSIHSAAVADLKPGRNITVKGNFTGYQKDETGLLGSDIKLNRCVISKQ